MCLVYSHDQDHRRRVVPSGHFWFAFYRTQVRFCFSAVCDFFCFLLVVIQISRERLNGFTPNLQRRRVWSLARMSLNVKVKGQRSRSSGKNALGTPVTPVKVRMVCARCKRSQSAADGPIPSLPGGDLRGLRTVYVWYNVFSSSVCFSVLICALFFLCCLPFLC